jgi:FKBP-type peptidyl-prolyl cis-trans isomerase
VKPIISVAALFASLLLWTGCKQKKVKNIEELPTKVESFNVERYKESSLDSSDFASMKRFGSLYDSSTYQSDLDSISNFFEAQNFKEVFYTNSGVVYAIKKYGKGIYPSTGDKLHVYTETRRWDGKLVFSSAQYKQPLEFILGTGQVVPAWDEVLPNIPAGSEVLIVAPSAMSYGKKAIPKTLPGNTILIYDIKLDKVFPVQENTSSAGKTMFQLNNESSKEEDSKNKIPSSIKRPTAK